MFRCPYPSTAPPTPLSLSLFSLSLSLFLQGREPRHRHPLSGECPQRRSQVPPNQEEQQVWRVRCFFRIEAFTHTDKKLLPHHHPLPPSPHPASLPLPSARWPSPAYTHDSTHRKFSSEVWLQRGVRTTFLAVGFREEREVWKVSSILRVSERDRSPGC